ncbi:hypothetical protein U0070_003795 [Myodes glareolus]|uniref:Uncharacterized protein n=1 Tax=Myodes glareolus TaxID=447135 RepID=A0AAW0HV25_MYOGA
MLVLVYAHRKGGRQASLSKLHFSVSMGREMEQARKIEVTSCIVTEWIPKIQSKWTEHSTTGCHDCYLPTGKQKGLLRVITDKNCESALCSGKALSYPETHLDYLDRETDRQTDRQGLEEGILPKDPGASTPTLYLVYDLESTAHLYGPEKERLGLHALEVPVQNSAKQV